MLKFSKGGKATAAELHQDDLGLLDPSGDTSLIQCDCLKVGQTANLIRIVITITRSEPVILITSRIVGECSYSTRE